MVETKESARSNFRDVVRLKLDLFQGILEENMRNRMIMRMNKINRVIMRMNKMNKMNKCELDDLDNEHKMARWQAFHSSLISSRIYNEDNEDDILTT